MAETSKQINDYNRVGEPPKISFSVFQDMGEKKTEIGKVDWD